MLKETFYQKLKEHHYESYGWALYCSRDHVELAKEALQTAYLKALKAQKSFKEESSFKTWFFTIIKHTCNDLLEQHRRLGNRFSELDASTVMIASTPNDSATHKPFFDKALAILSERQRELMHLVFYQDLSINEAAVLMDISGGAARKHYHRAKEQLRAYIAKNKIKNQ